MTNHEMEALRSCAEDLQKLASLEKACFVSNNKDADSYVKEKVKSYMMWFENIAEDILEVIRLSEECCGAVKKNRLDDIIFNHRN